MTALPSPTLTNPDMILPDSTGLDFEFSIGPPTAASTPIIYGHGTMLSDIGEVTEVESTPRRLPAPAERRALKGIGGSLRGNPSTGHSALVKRTKVGTHQRRSSIESTSTITSENHVAERLFADFDDGVSVDDSVFQGDDEESVAASSVADSYIEEVIASETRRLARKESDLDLNDESNSSAALSKRAEQILLNAKMRLNNMEGNLSRARGSLYVTPSASMPSIHSTSPLSRSTPSPPQNGYRIGSQLFTPSRHREPHVFYPPSGSPGHSRVYSENSIPSVQSQKAPFILRSASAGAGYIGPVAYRRSTTSQESLLLEDSINSSRPVSTSTLSRTSPPANKTSPLHGTPLTPLSENEVACEIDRSYDSGVDTYGYHSQSDSSRGLGLTRSASTMQMRDLRDQMHDLKGRLSSLRDRAKEDSMRRRSLQSLRTPSPFTAAEQWYTEHKAYKEDHLNGDKIVVQPPWKEDQTTPTPDNQREAGDDEREEASKLSESDISSSNEHEPAEEHARAATEAQISTPETEEDEENENYDTADEEAAHTDDTGDESESDYNEEMANHGEPEDYDSESEGSVYHDTIMPISHEDREDAFDYEHFFLHSAMGTMSQQNYKRRGSVDSFSSEGSVETARGLDTEADHSETVYDERTALGHLRNGSTESVSTLATFATASEGNYNEEEDKFNYAVKHFAPKTRTRTPLIVKRSTFGPTSVDTIPEVHSPLTEVGELPRSAGHDREPQTHGRNRPSVSSVDSMSSTGTTRSFPLVNKTKQTSPGANPASIVSASGSLNLIESQGDDRQRQSPVHMLAKEDQVLVERLVASLGKCVLGFQEAGESGSESRVWRRRLDAARRVLEGEEGAV
ncbi:hypothetical protein BP6252_00883 [Coleophoma cylindrospora]|uniref:Uncharacterized protein n=1 Tax=Coleophoma cylindrospora TaxID=1849047 RepID=A0A3D8SRQ0_9HELO|nr:hypothetical protein BP6252_00883 [Coleophoma cylindrospora]